MGLEEFSEMAEINGDTTMSDLVDIFGEEVVRRGVEYMSSLKTADSTYRSSVGDYPENYAESFGAEPEKINEDTKEEMESKWAEGMEESGLGLDE